MINESNCSHSAAKWVTEYIYLKTVMSETVQQGFDFPGKCILSTYECSSFNILLTRFNHIFKV